jgi:large subunit ribosomal protein L22
MKAHLRSIRIAPKKANLVAGLIRGVQVRDAVHILKRTPKKAARIIEALLQSAIANAVHNDRQNVDHLIVHKLIVNQAGAHHRGVPMARSRVRPIRKFMSHITMTLSVVKPKSQESSSSS